MKYFFSLLSLIILIGCGTTSYTEKIDPVTYKTNHYNKGYEHGCSSKYGEYKKNVRRYVKNNTYREGWNEGNFNCGKKTNKVYPFDKKAYEDGYKSAMYQRAIIKYRNESYRQSWKVGYNYYKKHPKKPQY